MNIENKLFWQYFEDWINIYKVGAIRDVTMQKYKMSLNQLKRIAPDLKCKDVNRLEYQKIINTYAETHEKVTTMDFHHHLKAAILDAIDEGLIDRDPSRKVVIKGKNPGKKKQKFLNQFELHALLKDLDLSHGVTFDWLILLIAKTGLRFSEALGVTPADFDFEHQTLTVNKTWDYKSGGGFVGTKNGSSIRTIPIDFKTVMQFSTLLEGMDENKPVFIQDGEQIFNSTVNSWLERHCKNVDIPVVTIHKLRHTHASLLLYQGVSIASVSRRLGHANMTTTQNTYLHVVQELENKDTDLIMRSVATLI